MKPTKSQLRMEAAQAEVARLWVLMCDEEGVAHDAKFVVFTSANQYAQAYNNAAKEFLRAKKAFLQARQKSRNRAAENDVIASLGMRRVRGALGGHYIE